MNVQTVEVGDFASHPAINTKVLVQGVYGNGKWADITWIDSKGRFQGARAHYAALKLLSKEEASV